MRSFLAMKLSRSELSSVRVGWAPMLAPVRLELRKPEGGLDPSRRCSSAPSSSSATSPSGGCGNELIDPPRNRSNVGLEDAGE